MNIYIRSTACISPQHTFGAAPQPVPPNPVPPPAAHPAPATATPQPAAPVEYTGTRLTCIEPEYKNLLDPKLIRRMSRIIKMGVAAATACLREAGEQLPDAIVTGTAYGCLEDTGLFLTSLIERNEEMLQPAPFIQSTHNTVGAQIALMLQCTRYNNTFVHRGFSFEHALLDAIMLLQEGEAANVLVGGMDEITDTSHVLLTRFGLYRRSPVSNLDLYTGRSKGTIAGEGAAFFLLANRPAESDNAREGNGNALEGSDNARAGSDYARLQGVTTFYKPGSDAEVERQILSFLAANSIDPDSIDLIITGANGDYTGDAIYRHLESGIFKGKPFTPYKHLCGEYPTATAFALWMAADRIRMGTRSILIYNHYMSVHHSLFLLSAAQTS
jgi:3-oxoacyl-[acyl-carrier-protein] synthase II